MDDSRLPVVMTVRPSSTAKAEWTAAGKLAFGQVRARRGPAGVTLPPHYGCKYMNAIYYNLVYS